MNKERELLRFTTCGSVDAGKSTLIGRLMYDTGNIYEDQLASIKRSSEKKGLDHIDLSLLTDGLGEEMQLGITIDVAYRYFHTNKRKFIIADTPGHFEYTRNMVTGCSNADAAIILIDACKGITEQTRRHSCLVSLLRIPNVIVCINKMDLVKYDKEIFLNLKNEYEKLNNSHSSGSTFFIPVSAFAGDNIACISENTNWYTGNTLLGTLETLSLKVDTTKAFRLPVQAVIQSNNDGRNFKGYAGRITGGSVTTGDEIIIWPEGAKAQIRSIYTPATQKTFAFAGESVTIELDRDLNVGRGSIFSSDSNLPKISKDPDAMICWLDVVPSRELQRLILRQSTSETKVNRLSVINKIDITDFSRITEESDGSLNMNDIATVCINTSDPVIYDPFAYSRLSGSFILVDERSNNTVAAGMFL